MKDGAGTEQPVTMDAATAAAIMKDTRDQALRRLRPDHLATFTAWGLIWFFGDGAMWLIVRGQHPYHGPSPAAYAAVVLLASLAALASVESNRAESGVGGVSAVRRRLFFVAVFLGYAGVFALEGALAHAGADRPVLGVFEAAAPVLVTGILYLARSAAFQEDWSTTGLGLWLVIVGAASGFAGPETVWGICALATGPAFLLAAGLQLRPRRA
jgi:hypothetical protein